MIISASTGVQHLRCCVRSLHHYPAFCNIKYQEAFNKTTEVDNTQGPNSSPSVHLWFPICCPLHCSRIRTSHFNLLSPSGCWDPDLQSRQEIICLLCAEPPAMEECSTAFGPVPQLSCSVRAPLKLSVWQQTPFLLVCLFQEWEQQWPVRICVIKWNSSGHCKVAERFSCWNY